MKIDLTLSDIYTIQDALADTAYKDARPIIDKLEAFIPREKNTYITLDKPIIKVENISVEKKSKVKVTSYIKETLDKLDPLPSKEGLQSIFPKLSLSTCSTQLSNYNKLYPRE